MRGDIWLEIAALSICWTVYFVLHSALASLGFKRWTALRLPCLTPYYRLGFNIMAAFLLLPILWITIRNPGPVLWRWRGVYAYIANGLALAAAAGFLLTLKNYDMWEFLGIKQYLAHSQQIEDTDNFHISTLHHYVRHPWYSSGLLMIWTRDMNAAYLLSSVMITGYIIIGSRLEEKKLLVYHGGYYRRYMEQVPCLIPLPWKTLKSFDIN